MVDKRAIKEEFERIRRILNEVWNPLPGSPEDEYDSYASRICSMIINQGAGVKEIAAYLLSVERDMMGYKGNEASCMKVSEKITGQ